MNQKDIFLLIQKASQEAQQTYERKSKFFLSASEYTSYIQWIKLNGSSVGNITSLILECSGHGSFNNKLVSERFANHFAQILSCNDEISKIKLKLSGLDLGKKLDVDFRFYQNKISPNKKPTLIQLISDTLNAEEKISKLTSLEIRICNVTNCSTMDFVQVMQLGVNQGAKQLVNLSFEFSDWSFALLEKDPKTQLIYQTNTNSIKKVEHDRNGQPSIEKFMRMLDSSFQNTLGHPMYDLKKFRLQISTWYYTDFQMQKFFFDCNDELEKILKQLPKNQKLPQRIQYFHNEFKNKVQSLIDNIMPELTLMSIDLRNWNKKFEMGLLKSSLLNINNKERINSMSKISRRNANNIISTVFSRIRKPPNENKQKKEEQYQSAKFSKIKNENKDKKEEYNQEPKQKFFDFVIVI